MTTKEWLKRGWKLDREINQMIEARDEAFTTATSTTCGTEGEKIQTSQKNTSEAKMIRYVAYTEQIDKRIDELYRIKREIMEAINAVENSTYRTLLIERYILYKKWEEIAVDMTYDYDYVRRALHSRALKSVPYNVP